MEDTKLKAAIRELLTFLGPEPTLKVITPKMQEAINAVNKELECG